MAPPLTAPRPGAAVRLTVPEAAEVIGVSSRTLYKLIARGEFPPAVRLGPKLLIVPRARLERWLAGERVELTPAEGAGADGPGPGSLTE